MKPNDGQPFVSIIIPMYNAAHYIEKCLESIAMSSYPSYEIIVVDDRSTDNSVEIVHNKGLKVLKSSNRSGPAASRNLGSKEAKGDILLFIDSDIVIQKNTMARLVDNFNREPDTAAIFGSYDDRPAEKDFFSQYMNLRHHFIHQISSKEAVTFWAGCGAIRKDVFYSLSGFDDKKYSKPCIEDIELGYRLKKEGYRICLDKDLQVKHLKKWSFMSVLRTDIFQRAIPWTKLILESQQITRDLNLQISQKVSTALLGLTIVAFLLSFLLVEFIYLAVILLFCIIAINHKLFNFFRKQKGLPFAILAFSMYLLYYLYSGSIYTVCWILNKI